MKKAFFLLQLCFLLFIKNGFSQGIAINETGSLPDESAILDISSVNKGLLIPRVVLLGLNDTVTIKSPAKSLMVYNKNSNYISEGFYYWDSTKWQYFGVLENAWNTTGNDSIIGTGTYFLGTTDNTSLIFKTNNDQKMIITNNGKIGIGTSTPYCQLSLSKSFSLPITTDSKSSIIYKDTVLFIHHFKYPNAGGNYNMFFGLKSGNLTMNSSSNSNVGVGTQSMQNLTGGYENTGCGAYTLMGNTSGYRNSAFGSYALQYNSTGNYNAALGHYALWANTTAEYNAALGMQAQMANTTGAYNTGIGTQALYSNTTSSYNTAIGCRAYLNNSYTNSTAIGYEAAITASNQIRVGNSTVTSIGGYVAWSNLSDSRFKKDVRDDVKGIEFIMLLRPVTFKWKMNELAAFLGEAVLTDSSGVQPQLPSEIINARNGKASIRYSGFIAQEVEHVADSIGYDFSGIIPPQNSNDLYRLNYEDFVMPLVKAVQEQQHLIENIQVDILEIRNQFSLILNTLNSGNN